MRTTLHWLTTGQIANFYEHGNKLSSFIKQWRDY